MPHHPRLVIGINDADGRRLAGADIEVVGPSMARASLHVESGHVPMGTRPRLVDAVLDEGNVASCTHLLVAVPLGDTEILDRVRQRCRVTDTHPAWIHPAQIDTLTIHASMRLRIVQALTEPARHTPAEH